MQTYRKRVFNTNKVHFYFEGYLSKLIHLWKDDVIEQTIAIETSLGPNKKGRVRFSLAGFTQDLSVLEEGKPYLFEVGLATDYNTEVELKHVVSVTPLPPGMEPKKGIRNECVGKIIGSVQTDHPYMDFIVVDFLMMPDSNTEEIYRCRMRTTDKGLKDRIREGTWRVSLELKQTPWQLSWADETKNMFHIEEELETYWVKEKDEQGNFITFKDSDGNEIPKVKKVKSRVFIEALELTPIEQVTRE